MISTSSYNPFVLSVFLVNPDDDSNPRLRHFNLTGPVMLKQKKNSTYCSVLMQFLIVHFISQQCDGGAAW